MGKSTQQPFSIVDRRAHVPFYLVHSDVWMYPIFFLLFRVFAIMLCLRMIVPDSHGFMRHKNFFLVSLGLWLLWKINLV